MELTYDWLNSEDWTKKVLLIIITKHLFWTNLLYPSFLKHDFGYRLV